MAASPKSPYPAVKATATVSQAMPDSPDSLIAKKPRVPDSSRRRASSSDLPDLKYTFRDRRLLQLALTHRSISYENNPEALADPGADNEQLEFVGDAVLGLVVAESLYRRFRTSREGELTRLRASLVGGKNLAAVGSRLDLGRWLRLGRGEEQSGGRIKPALLANALEAVIAALYLDGGLDAARSFIEREIVIPSLPELAEAMEPGRPFSGAIGDYKSALQEHLQASGLGQPEYVLLAESGPDHRKRFHIQVRIGKPDGSKADGSPDRSSTAISDAEGSTKKQAQQEAARIAYSRLLAEQPNRNAALREDEPHDASAASQSTAMAQGDRTHDETEA